MKNALDLSDILNKIYKKISKEITNAYFNGTIDELLKKYDLDDKISYSYYDVNNSKILVLGDSAISKDIMVAIAKDYGISSDRIDFQLDYDRLHNYDFENLRNNMIYSDVLVGPLPHKVEGINGYSSFLAMVKSNPEEFPKVIKMSDSNGLKITKQSFKTAIIKTRFYNEIVCEI